MKILAFEFSSKRRSVAAGMTGKEKTTRRFVTSHDTEPENSKPFQLVTNCLAQMEWSPGDVEGIVVSLGPGSYTGIRTAMAMAEGWHLAKNIPLAGLSTMQVLARDIPRRPQDSSVWVAIPSTGREYHAAEIGFSDHAPPTPGPLRLLTRDEVESKRQSGARWYGPELQNHFPEAVDLYPSAESVWRCVSEWSEFPTQPLWEPISLRSISYVKASPAKHW